MSLSPKLRTLYLLALFQLVAGPAVLVGVMVLGKLTVQEAPRHGVAVALAKAWKSAEFQTLLLSAQADLSPASSKAPAPDSQSKPEMAKVHWAAWAGERPQVFESEMSGALLSRLSVWTPAWPQAPPGPPPRVA